MANLVVHVWKNQDGKGEPEVEIKIPTHLAKWVPRLMKFVPKKTRDETWGEDIDFESLAKDIDQLAESSGTGPSQLVTIKSKDAFVSVSVEK